MMSRLSIARWTVDVDPVATAKAYSSFNEGSCELCGCAPCRNFIANRDVLFPDAVTEFFREAGIASGLEIETGYYGEVRNGVHLYSAWFHFVGALVAGDDALIPHADGNGGSYDLAPINDAFSAGITSNLSCLTDVFPRDSTLQLEFTVELPWVVQAGT
jgi:hypothetical protein